MDPRNDTGRIAGLFAARISTARNELLERMERSGLAAAAGWRVYEEVVNTPKGMAYRLRALHGTEVAPAGFDVLVSLD